jgi:hypothetical protein
VDFRFWRELPARRLQARRPAKRRVLNGEKIGTQGTKNISGQSEKNPSIANIEAGSTEHPVYCWMPKIWQQYDAKHF